MFKSSIIYLLTSIFNRGIPFLILPLLTHYLLPAEYGYVALFQLMVAFLHPLLNLNGNLFISKEYYSATKNYIKLINGNYLIVVSLFSIILIIILLIFNGIILSSLKIAFFWWAFAMISGILNSIYLNYLTLLRCQDRPFVYAIYEITKSILDVALTLAFVIMLKFGWEGRAIGVLSSISLMGLITLYFTIRGNNISFSFNKEVCKKILQFCLPLVPFSLGTMVINFSDRIFIERLTDVSDLGIYSVAYTLGMSMLVFTESFNKAWTPMFFKALQNYEANKIGINKKIGLYVVGVITLPFIIYLLSKYIIFPFFIDVKYLESLQYIFGIAFAYAFHGIFLILYPYLVWQNKTSVVGTVTLVSLVINLVLNYFLISSYGLKGAVWATVLTYAFMTACVFVYVIIIVKNRPQDTPVI